VVRNLRDFFQASVPKRAQLHLDLASDVPLIEADTSQLEQVVMNLVVNGAEAIPEGRAGRVRVSTRAQKLGPQVAADFQGLVPEPGSYAVLEVEDDGIGMDSVTLSKIFDPFFSTKFMGRGLGLAAVQGIVRGHRGALTVQSTPGAGTTFTMFFPASAATLLESDSRSTSGARRAMILVVDDEEIVRRTATTLLEQHGYSVITAENGKAALELFRRLGGEIDAVLLDLTMPVMDGEETLRGLKAVRPDVRVILSSGNNEAEAVRRFAGDGLAGFIQKPYTSTRLAEKIRRTLQNGEAAPMNA